MASSSTAWLESQVKAFDTCQAVCDLVQHGEANSILTLLKRWPLQYLQHFLHTRGVMVPVKGKATALCWTISILEMLFLVCGSKTLEAYSRIGLIIAVYALSLTLHEPIFRFRLRNPSILFALTHMLSDPSKVSLDG